MLATIVDTEALLNTVLASLVAGLGVTLVFSLAIFGTARAIDMSRDLRRGAAVAFGILAALAFVASAAAIAVGIVVMTTQ